MALIVHDDPIPEGGSALLSVSLVDAYGAPFAEALSTLTLTYYDKSTEAIINSRDSQDVLNTNNVTFGTVALGAISCTFIAATKVIRRLTGNWLQTAVVVGAQLTLTGTVSNNGTVTVTRVTATDVTVSEVLVGEVAVTTTISMPGRIVWTMQPTDTVLVDSRKEEESHIALFVWTWDSGSKSGSQEVQVTVENLSLHP